MTILMAASKVGRNDPCPCGSGKKYKLCCGRTTSKMSRISLFAVIAVVVTIVATLVYTLAGDQDSGASGQVWDPEHNHYHPRR